MPHFGLPLLLTAPVRRSYCFARCTTLLPLALLSPSLRGSVLTVRVTPTAKRSRLLAASRQPHAALQVRRVGEVVEERELPHGVRALKARGAQVLAERRRVAADVEHLVELLHE